MKFRPVWGSLRLTPVCALLRLRTIDERAEINGRTYADSEVFSSLSLDIAFSQKMHITCPLTRACFEDKESEGAYVSIIPATKVSASWPHLVSMLLEYRIRIYFLIVAWKMVVRWYTVEVENSEIRFHNSLHLGKQASNSFRVTGWIWKVFIRY